MIEATAREAWRDVEARLRPFVARRVRAAADIDDVVQEIFLRVQRGLCGLRDEERFGPWVYQVARSAIADHHRASQRHALIEQAAAQADTAESSDDDGAPPPELVSALALFIAELPSPYREALTLTELEGISQKDAAAMLDVSVSGMKSRVQRGRAKLKAALDACCTFAVDARGRVVACERRPNGRLPDGCCD